VCVCVRACVCVSLLRSITIFQRLLRAPVLDRRLFYRVPFHSPRFDRGFINFLPNQTSDEDRFRLHSARERIIAANKSGIGETENNSERFKRY